MALEKPCLGLLFRIKNGITRPGRRMTSHAWKPLKHSIPGDFSQKMS
jgi:hypothetical protein